MSDLSKTVVFTRTQIQETVERLAQEVALWLETSQAKGLNLISVLEGAKPFTRDLSEGLRKRLPGLFLQVHEVRVKGTDGTALLKDRQFQSPFLAGENLGPHPLLIVDDLVDSGLTLKLLRREMENLKKGEVKTAVLIRKFGEASGPIDFRGFELDLDLKELISRGLKDYWLYGYGMNLDGRQRDLDHIGWKAIPLGNR